MEQTKSKTYLAIETSCDETSVAIIRYEHTSAGEQTFTTLAHLTLSQIDLHRPYGGVYPNLARREHETNIIPVIAQALETAGILSHIEISETEREIIQRLAEHILSRETVARPITMDFLSHHKNPNLDGIIVTVGPGLAPALWVGVNIATMLAKVWNIPCIPVNHMEGHIFSVFATGESFVIPSIEFSALSLLISGGHTEIVLMQDWYDYTIIGQTLDDAIGEAFDKTARLMDLPYPGGPEISKLAREYREYGTTLTESEQKLITLPRPMMHSQNYDFSFSGIKTAVRYLIEKLPGPLSQEMKRAIAYEFETAVTEVLVKKIAGAIDEYGIQTLIVGGGVSANQTIRAALENLSHKKGISVYLPKGVLSMDNALMIAIVGAIKADQVHYSVPDLDALIKADGGMRL